MGGGPACEGQLLYSFPPAPGQAEWGLQLSSVSPQLSRLSPKTPPLPAEHQKIIFDAQHFLRVEMLLLEKLVHLYIYAQVQGNFHDGHTWRTRQAMFLVLILSLTN